PQFEGLSGMNASASPPGDSAGESAKFAFVAGRTERRIQWLTPLMGAVGAIGALASHRRDWAAGVVIGSVLAWLNFRWLKRGLDGLVAAAQAQYGHQKPRVSLWTYTLLTLRYVLLAVAVYVIFKYLHIPLGSLVVGLCALGAATIVASVWEMLTPGN